MRIEHANITVNDVDASARFYCTLFGAHIRWEGVTEAGHRAAHIGDEDTYLSLFEAASAGRVPEDYTATGFNHLGFEVDDLERYRRRLEEMGVALKREEVYAPGRRLYCFDPDGIEIELVQY